MFQNVNKCQVLIITFSCALYIIKSHHFPRFDPSTVAGWSQGVSSLYLVCVLFDIFLIFFFVFSLCFLGKYKVLQGLNKYVFLVLSRIESEQIRVSVRLESERNVRFVCI